MKMFKKFNLFKNCKYILICFATLILAGIIVFCCCGFNLGIDFVGGGTFNVEPVNASLIESSSTYENEFVKKQNDIINKVELVLKNNGMKLSSAQIEGEGSDQTVVFTFKNKAGVHLDDLKEFNEDLKAQLTTNLSLVSEKIDYEVDGIYDYDPTVSFNVLMEIGAICLILLLVFIYFAVRFFPYAAISTVLGIFVQAITVLSVLIFTRIEITKFVAVSVLVGFVLFCISQVLIFVKVKDSYLENQLGEKTNKEIVSAAVKSSTLLTLILNAFVILIGIVLLFVNSTFALYLIIPAIISVFVSIFIAPEMFGFIAKKKRFVPIFNKFNK